MLYYRAVIFKKNIGAILFRNNVLKKSMGPVFAEMRRE
jgi:hypothetical protein